MTPSRGFLHSEQILQNTLADSKSIVALQKHFYELILKQFLQYMCPQFMLQNVSAILLFLKHRSHLSRFLTTGDFLQKQSEKHPLHLLHLGSLGIDCFLDWRELMGFLE